LASGRPKLLLVDLLPNPDLVKASKFPKQISVASHDIDLDLPKPGATSATVYAFLLGKQALDIDVGVGRGAPKRMQLQPKKIVPIGEGSVDVSRGGRSLFVANPGPPGSYVCVLLPLEDGSVRALPLEFVVDPPEEANP
jgi:hypothetical protein